MQWPLPAKPSRRATSRTPLGVIAGRVRETPLLPAGELSRRVGARVLLKAENLQLTGSFKARGATNVVGRLPDEALRAGVVAASAGNHAQAVAFAARDAGARAVLVMPEEAPLAKVAAVRQYGGEVRLRRRLRRRRSAEARAARRGRAGRSCTPSTAPRWWRARGPSGSRSRAMRPTSGWSWCRWAAAAWPRGIALAVAALAARRARGRRAGRGLRALHRLARRTPADLARARRTRSATASPSSGRATSRCRSSSATWTRS